jgi:hypothetical protein
VSAFTLDASGEINVSVDDATHLDHAGSYVWSDLTPFAQGYVEAMFIWGRENIDLEASRWRDNIGFSDLAPETLARIIADTDMTRGQYPERLSWQGAQWFMHRQANGCGWAPPLTVTLGDDGKVRLS